jgi:(1->4)-alpha-D-glucan 1-alpha-D-glucosylmutase
MWPGRQSLDRHAGTTPVQARRVRIPRATYRLQFGPGLGFEDARRLVPYLDALGISDLYASPLLKARAGSTHGYDVTDPTTLNPELGTREEFDALTDALRERGMGLLLDIVPNHMAMSSQNPWWMDVLEHGRSSPYSVFFAIDWEAPRLEGKVLVPILGSAYGEVLDRGEIRLDFEPGSGTLSLAYFEHCLPVDPRSYRLVLGDRLDRLEGTAWAGSAPAAALRELAARAAAIPRREEAERRDERLHQAQALRADLAKLYRSSSEELRAFVDGNVRRWGGRPRGEGTLERLDRLMGEQAYLLSNWRVAPEEIDYRRFFDIADLVAMRTSEPAVFAATHALILELAGEGRVTGLRIDHVDGLRDPGQYLRWLQQRQPAYVVVEKILAGREALPRKWQTAGTTGYEVLNDVNGVLVDPEGWRELRAARARLTGGRMSFHDLAFERKQQVMEQLFEGEVVALAARLQRLARQDRRVRDLTRNELARALADVTAALPVYRTYTHSLRVSAADRRWIEQAVREARRRSGGQNALALDFLRRVLVLDRAGRLTPERADTWLAFVMRWQQFSGPVMAKGVEDTAMYLDTVLVSRNEVGGDPGDAPVDPAAFHRRARARLRSWPDSMIASTTHDTKRSEDVRARIAVLSEVPGEWADHVSRWTRRNASRKREVHGSLAPDPNEEYLLYQTMLGAWPLADGEHREFVRRMKDSMQKALREAKVHTNWIDPDPAYERAVQAYVGSILAPGNRRFLRDFEQFQRKVAFHGMLNALGQVVLKICSPGVPDFYQGTELWHLRLVDPDNRILVDFQERAQLLDGLHRAEAEAAEATEAVEELGVAGDRGPAADLPEAWADGRLKLFVTSRALAFRRDHPELFARGDHIPLAATDPRRGNVLAFARRRRGEWLVAAVPRLTTQLTETGRLPLGTQTWGTSALPLPKDAPRDWVDVFTESRLSARLARGRSVLRLADTFASFPAAMLTPVPT